ncbi:MAG: hypothetical protein AVDCRST_MAG10-2718 [uncultured Acidimicrobiales bacterium]|uniref:DUF1206 domain-containing protein n=1 Tax=uncultured Acidimicrobiales bacterium TaxID=310071 RepID=A0A6J4IVF5_9ACTN|nr:MAG: hypothetical protein AVDCRST_MAG10-2718 [uncultured Acidimicrobiales bacterium]
MPVGDTVDMGGRVDVEDVKDRAEDALEDAADSTWLERLARAGLVARGLLYVVVGILALQVATGHDETRADKQGALQSVVRQPFGRLLVLLLAVGFAGYALWRFVEAAVGPPDEKDGRKANLKRIGYAARGGLYAFFCGSAVKLFIWSNQAGAAERPEADWTGRVLNWPGGTWLVQAVGLGLIGAGLYVGWRGLAGKFRKRLKALEMGPVARRWVRWIGAVGMVARMLVLAMIGVFLIAAARGHDPNQAVGIDGALKRLADRTYGPMLLVFVAFGLGAYGLYSFAEARYRRVCGH